MDRLRFLRACLACTLLIAANVTAAQSLRLDEAVIRTLQSNPDLAVFAHELRAQQGRVQQASARPAIELGVLVENAFGTGPRSSLDAAETTLSLDFMLEHGALQRRRESALAGVDVLDAELNIQRIDVAAETSRRFITVLEQQQQVVELRGRYSYVEWAAAQRELLEMRRSLWVAYANAHRYRVEIERLTGASLTARTLR